MDHESKFRQAAEALFEGNAESAAQLFTEGAQAIAATRPAIDPNAVANQVVEEMRRERLAEQAAPAIKKLSEAYPEIVTDPDYALIADRKVHEYETKGYGRAEAILKAGADIGEKFKLGKHKPRTSQQPTPQDEPEADDVADAAATIAEMQRSRAAAYSEESSGRQTAQAHDGLKDEHARMLAFRRHRASQQQ